MENKDRIKGAKYVPFFLMAWHPRDRLRGLLNDFLSYWFYEFKYSELPFVSLGVL